MKKLKAKEKKDETKETQEEELRRTFSHIQAFSYIQTCLAHNRDFTQRLYHTHMFYIQVLNTQTLLHTETLLHIKPIETQKVF